MDSFELNKIIGAVLGTLLFVMGVGFLAEAIYHPIDNTSGVLYQGTSWFVCQRRFPVKIWYGSAANDYTRRLLQSFPESQQARSLNAQNQS